MGSACAPILLHFPLTWVSALKLSRLELILPHPVRGTLADKVLIQFIEADVDIGFGLIDEAKAFCASGQPELSVRVLQDAAGIVVDIECRLQRLSDSESGPFHPLVTELRNQIAAAQQKNSL